MCNGDAELMLAYQSGDERAFAELYLRYASTLVRYFTRRGKRQADAQDLAQETFLHLHRSRADFRVHEALRPWLFTIARNVCHDHGRRAQRRPEALCDVDRFQAPEQARDHAAALVRAERCEALSAALAQLPAADRNLLDEHWFADRAFSEIAARDGVQCSTLRVRAHRACQRLRERISVRYRAVA